MANSDKNILITPNISSATGVYPNIKFTGSNNSPITLNVLDTGALSFSGTAGQLFTIQDGLSGTIFAVNDISGIPLVEVTDTSLTRMNPYGGSTVFGGSAAIQNSSAVNAKVSISTATASTPGLIIKGVASQTADLQQWQNSGGTVQAYVDYYGNFFTIRAFKGQYFGDANDTTPYLDFSSNKFTVNPRNASYVGLVVKGVASQTADLQQWQNSSGTALAKVDASGNLTANNFPSGAWTSYTPALSTNGNTITLGNGTVTGSYNLIGKTCHFRMKFTIGSTTSIGSGEVAIGLPFTAASADYQFTGAMLDNGNTWYGVIGNGNYLGSTTRFALMANGSSGTAWFGVTNNNLFSLLDGDYIVVNGTYEIA